MPNIVISNPSNQQVMLDDIVIEPNTSRGVAMGTYTLDVTDTAIVVNNGSEYVPEKILQMEDGSQVIVAEAVPADPELLITKVGNVWDVHFVPVNTSVQLQVGTYNIKVV